MTHYGWLRSLDKLLTLVIANLVVIALMAMVAIVLTLVIGRSVFGVGFFWGEELARYTMIFMAFLGGAVSIRSDQHPRLTVFVSMLPESVQNWIGRVIAVLLAGTLGLLVWQGLDVAINDGRMRTPALRIKYFWVFLAVPIGAAAMLAMLAFQQFLPSAVSVNEQDDIEEIKE